jgi:hypothetical protein
MEQQASALHAWHAATASRLAAFSRSFERAAARVTLCADATRLSLAAEQAVYEGPLSISVSNAASCGIKHTLSIGVGWVVGGSLLAPELGAEASLHH